MIKDKIDYYALEVFLICTFVLNLFTTSISNYTLTNFILKASALILFIGASYLSFRTLNISLLSLLNDSNIIKSVIYLLLFSTLTGLTLFYSENQYYGFIKWVNLTFITLPFVIIIVLQYNNYNYERLKILILTFGIISIILSISIILFQPFDYLGIPYNLDITRWSHVIIGRLLSLFVLISLLCIMFLKKSRLLNFNYAVFIISTYAIYLTGLRAALTGFIILILIMLFLILIIKKLRSRTIHFVFPIIIVLLLTILFPLQKDKPIERLHNLIELEDFNFGDDGTIKARLNGWQIGWEMYKDNTIWGLGIGGYNNYYKSEIPKLLKYPHNLFVELIVEYGILGIGITVLILFSIIKLFFRIIKSVLNKMNAGDYLLTPAVAGKSESRRGGQVCILTSVFLILLFFLWLGMFSKDIATQSILYIIILFIIKHQN